MKDKILIGVSILLVIGIAIAVYFSNGLSNENEGLTDDVKQLSKELEDLEDDLSASQDEAAALEADIAALFDETTTLSGDIEETTSMITGLTTTEEELEIAVEWLSGYGVCDFGFTLGTEVFVYGVEDDRENNRIMLLLWYFFSVGEVVDSEERFLWEDDPDSPDFILYQEASEDWDGFLIFYYSGKPDGVFFIDQQCWVDIDF